MVALGTLLGCSVNRLVNGFVDVLNNGIPGRDVYNVCCVRMDSIHWIHIS